MNDSVDRYIVSECQRKRSEIVSVREIEEKYQIVDQITVGLQ